MLLTVALTLLVCTILLLAALRRIDHGLGAEVAAKYRRRPPVNLGHGRRGHGLFAFGLEALLARGLAVRPPPASSV
jgi:hypothetical protein